MIKKLEKVFKALGDRNRLRIVNMLAHKPLCVCEITYILQVSQSTVSGHLRVLKEAQLVIDEKDGMWVNYHLNEENTWGNEFVEAVKRQALQDSLMENDIRLLKRVDRKEILCRQ
jgi:ArsR family transcriptional regulator